MTDLSKPFTLKVVEPKTTWFGRLKYVTVHAEQFRYPEQMLAEASKYNGTGLLVWTFGPDLELWSDDRDPYVDKSFTLSEVLDDRQASFEPPAVDSDGDPIPF